MTGFPPIGDLLPHREPAILLDTVENADGTSIACALLVRPQCPFFTEGKGIASHAAVEWMAQACAAYAGWEDLQKGGVVTLGLLLGTRNFQATMPWFAPGLDLIVEARLSYRDATIGVFDCMVRERGGQLSHASAQLTVYQPEDAQAFLKEQG